MISMALRHIKKVVSIFVLLCVGAYFWITNNGNNAINYLTESVRRQDISLTVLADGTLEAQKQVSVGSQVSGQIKKLHIALGDAVTKGDLLAEIDDLPQKNSLADAKARLKNTEASKAAKLANLENAKLTFERQSLLSNKGASRVSEFDTAKANLAALLAEVEAMDAQISQAKIALDTAILNLSYTQIHAPMSGVVVALVVEEGQTVNSVQSAPTLIKIANLSTMTVKAQISEADVIKVKVGLPVYFTILGDKKRYQAQLRQIEPAPESIKLDSNAAKTTEAIYYNGLFDVDNSDGLLRISMTAQVVIMVKEAKSVLTIPVSAITFNQKNNQKNNQKTNNQDKSKEKIAGLNAELTSQNNLNNAMVRVLMPDGTIDDRSITTGLNNNIQVAVLTGLDEDEKVVISDSSAQLSKTLPRGMGKL